MKPIRSFIAVDISESIREKIGQFLKELQQIDADIKWIKPENMHITLKFLGDVELSLIEQIVKKIGNIGHQVVPFALTFQGTGYFPNINRPRILWAGIREGSEQLGQLADKVNKTLIQLNFEPERKRFKSHLTLGRVRSNKNIQCVVEKMKSNIIFGSTGIHEIIYMQSELKPTGAVYTPLHHIQLQG